MNSNYSWQMHQTNERQRARLQEAAVHRSLRRNNKEGEPASNIVIFAASGIAALIRQFVSHKRSSNPKTAQSA